MWNGKRKKEKPKGITAESTPPITPSSHQVHNAQQKKKMVVKKK
jgi:hypothetical protein